jgi:hypothetical protein
VVTDSTDRRSGENSSGGSRSEIAFSWVVVGVGIWDVVGVMVVYGLVRVSRGRWLLVGIWWVGEGWCFIRGWINKRWVSGCGRRRMRLLVVGLLVIRVGMNNRRLLQGVISWCFVLVVGCREVRKDWRWVTLVSVIRVG